jgi:foldase protein PrsA
MLEEPQVKTMLASGKVSESDLRRNLTTLMPLDKLAEKRITSDDEKQYLLAHREELETIRVSHIVLGSEIEAKAVVNRLKKPGADFAKLAGDCSLDPQSKDKGGDLGELHRSDMEPSVSEVLFRTPVDSYSPIIRTQMGYHVFLVTGHKFEYKDLQPAVHAILVDGKRGEVLEELRKKASIEVSPPFKMPVEPAEGASPGPSSSPVVDQN